MTRELPAVSIGARGAALWRAGQPFVARQDLTQLADAPDADVVRVLDPRGAALGSALQCAAGRIALRVLSREGRPLDGALLRERLRLSLQRRETLWGPAGGPDGAAPDAYRVVHAEADGLPGLFVDRYGDAAVIQTATRAMDARVGEIAAAVAEVLAARLVVRRDDGSARELEGLARVREVVWTAPGAGPDPGTVIQFHDAGAVVEADLLVDGKTGAFLDQQENHLQVLAYARRQPAGALALDAFTYHGGFALALARGGLRVQACDENPAAVARARKNAALSGVDIDFQVANAFDLLRGHEAQGRRYRVVVVDPPALAKRGGRQPAGAQAAHQAALRAYKELNLRALRLLEPEGLLVTCSCSGRVTAAQFGEMLESAARDAGRALQVLEQRGAGRDHPALLGVPETAYLKAWFLRAL